MNSAIFCPLCNAHMVSPGRYPIIVTGPPRAYYLGLVLTCINCAATTELNEHNGDLLEFPRWLLSNILEPYNMFDMPLTLDTLRLSHLTLGES